MRDTCILSIKAELMQFQVHYMDGVTEGTSLQFEINPNALPFYSRLRRERQSADVFIKGNDTITYVITVTNNTSGTLEKGGSVTLSFDAKVTGVENAERSISFLNKATATADEYGNIVEEGTSNEV